MRLNITISYVLFGRKLYIYISKRCGAAHIVFDVLAFIQICICVAHDLRVNIYGECLCVTKLITKAKEVR